MTLCRSHFLRVTAAQRQPDDTTDFATASAYELMLMQLAEHKRRLKGIQSFEQRAELKRQWLPDYQAWVDGVLDSQSGQADAVLTTIMQWKIDVGDIEGALPLAQYALAHNLAMPDNYKRNVATVLAEEAAEQALRHMAPKEHELLDIKPLLAVDSTVANHDMPDQVRAKLFKAIGYALREHDYLSAALGFLERALQLHDNCGVKKDIEKLTREVDKGKGLELTNDIEQQAAAASSGE